VFYVSFSYIFVIFHDFGVTWRVFSYSGHFSRFLVFFHFFPGGTPGNSKSERQKLGENFQKSIENESQPGGGSRRWILINFDTFWRRIQGLLRLLPMKRPFLHISGRVWRGFSRIWVILRLIPVIQRFLDGFSHIFVIFPDFGPKFAVM